MDTPDDHGTPDGAPPGNDGTSSRLPGGRTDPSNGGIASLPCQSLLVLQGLGKEVWKGVDVDAYLEQERASWE